ncbi:MAG TPA: hypothetical protein VL992_16750 [Tepidisphaeraceae bacterium]|nr:hypothetical protein [Tepidisphaeraceae bacterium]
MRKSHQHSDDEILPEIDERYWRKAILQRSYYRREIGFDRYRWALRFGQMARRRHHGTVEFAEVIHDLASAWAQFGGPIGLSWEEACAAIEDSWAHTSTIQAEAIASQGGYKSPPSFKEHGHLVPRNMDEANA